MKNKARLPDWLILWIWRALIGEIYPNIRAIAASFTENNELIIRYYLDRHPTDFDYESLGYVMTYVLSSAPSNEVVKTIKEECEYSIAPFGELEVLDGLVYARREYDI
jgi:hypothetical protein